MKINLVKKTISLSVFAFATQCSFSQSFSNLNFEAANLTGYPAGINVPITNAIPNWMGYFGSTIFGTQQVSEVGYDTVSLGGGGIFVIDTDVFGLSPIQGKYSVFLQGSSAAGPYSVAIGQSSLVPVMTQSLIFWGTFAGAATFNGQAIPYITLGSTANYTIYGGDISAFAGQTGELRFTTPPNSGGILDNIQFSTQSIPEPNTYSLLGCGVLLLRAARVAFKRKP